MLCHRIITVPRLKLRQQASGPFQSIRRNLCNIPTQQQHCKFFNKYKRQLLTKCLQDSRSILHYFSNFCTLTTSTMDSVARKALLQHYEPPDWAAGLKVVPKFKIQVSLETELSQYPNFKGCTMKENQSFFFDNMAIPRVYD